jgi:4-hydroxy-2-oxoglutarate aldolase
MMRMKRDYKSILSGIFPSITTPFIKGEVSISCLASNIEKYNEFDLGGYMVLGGNGEYLGLTEKETYRVVETIIENKKADRPIVAGVGRESAEATVRFIKSLVKYGIDIASVITPYYFAKHMKDENLIAYYLKVADESPIPILIYNSPEYAAGVEVSPYVISVLSRHENIVGMKNSSGRELSVYTAASQGQEFYYHAGKSQTCYRDLAQGAVGATLSMAIYWPQICIQLYRLYIKGRTSEAEQLSESIKMINRLGVSKYGVPGVKYAMDLAGFFGGEPRLPLLPLTDAQKQEIRKAYEIEKGVEESYEDIDRM